MKFFNNPFKNDNNELNSFLSLISNTVEESLKNCPVGGKKVEKLFIRYNEGWNVGFKSGKLSKIIKLFQTCILKDSELSDIKTVTIIGIAKIGGLENITIRSPPDWWGDVIKSVFQIRLEFKNPIWESGLSFSSADHLVGKVNNRVFLYLAHAPWKSA